MIVVHLNINQTQGIVELILSIGLRQNDFSANKWQYQGARKGNCSSILNPDFSIQREEPFSSIINFSIMVLSRQLLRHLNLHTISGGI
jgi:hypothetical protein